MAEGWGRKLKSNKFNFYSAGTKKHGMNEYAIKVMSEVGVDLSLQHSKTLDELEGIKFDIIFTVCSDAHENCPFVPGAKMVHVGFDDPPRLTKDMAQEEEKLKVYRRVRDEIFEFVSKIESHLDNLENK